jgi:hypothetical protein
MDDDDAQAALSKNLKMAVSNSYACNAILLEVVKDIVRSKKGQGLKYLDDLFRRVGFRLDAFDGDDDRRIGQTAETRAAVSTFFAWAKEATAKPKAPKAAKRRAAAPAKKRKRRARSR